MIFKSEDFYEFKKVQYDKKLYAFDIETTSLYYIDEQWITMSNVNRERYDYKTFSEALKIALPYLWQFAIEDTIIIGREISDFIELLIYLKSFKKIIYVHNLGFEFEFLREYLADMEIEIFARKPHAPIYFRIKELNVEFRCSYILTNLSLKNAAKAWADDGLHKMIGDLDYTVLRTPLTPMSNKELRYAINDVKIIISILRNHFIPLYGCAANIPYTQTGEVRRVVKNEVLNSQSHLNKMRTLKPDLGIYKILTRVLTGGTTHCNYLFSDMLIEDDVYSYDMSSSYPSVMSLEKYPYSPWEECDVNFDSPLFCYLINCDFYNIQSITAWDYISYSKCEVCENPLGEFYNDNGRVFKAEHINMWLTDIDLEIIKKTYHIGAIIINKKYRSVKRYLPLEFVNFVLTAYSTKTSLKGVEGHEFMYAKQKQYNNSGFGMAITNNIRDEVLYTDNWFIHPLSEIEIVEKLKNERPFLSFSWGVFILAYARRNLWKMLIEVGNEAVYCDTDSVKFINADNIHKFDIYNENHYKNIQEVCRIRGLDINLFTPKDIKGITHTLGAYERDGVYAQFKSLGAKKYAYVDKESGHFNFVVAGLKKSYIDENGNEVPTLKSMAQFEKDSIIEHGKTVIMYTTNQPVVEISDTFGNVYVSTQKNGVVVIDGNHTLGVAKEYQRFLSTTHNKYTNPKRFSLDGGVIEI